MDTGSTGVVIGASLLGLDLEDLKKYQAGNEYLGSSGVFWEGYWLTASDVNLTFTAANLTAKVPILAVTETSSCGNFNNGECEEGSKTNITQWPNTRYLGVGFGRWKAAQPDKTPDKVPLTNIAFADGAPVSKDAINAGYVITSTGVHVGLTSQNTQGFATTKLDLTPESPAPRDWAQVDMSLAVDNSHWNSGHALFDTGIGYSFISVDAETTKQLQKTLLTDDKKKNHSVLVPGSEVHMRVGNAPDFIAYYNVTAGDKDNNVGPNRGEFRTQAASVPAFLNTGRNFYRGFDAFFDSECGWFGLRWTGEVGDEDGGLYSAGV